MGEVAAVGAETEDVEVDGVMCLGDRLETEAAARREGGDDRLAQLLDDARAALSYYSAGLLQERPDWVPDLVKLEKSVAGDGPFRSTRATEGTHACECNRWGAVTIKASNGQALGIKPAEFEVMRWKRNEL